MDQQRQWQLLDLCCAFSMYEAGALRHRIPLKDTEWEWVPKATRLALPALAKEARYEIPKSLALLEADGEGRAAAIRELMPLAREIVPLHRQSVAVLEWLRALTRLEARGVLEQAALAEKIRKGLRGTPYVYRSVDADIAEHR